jgi:hypothetical protein
MIFPLRVLGSDSWNAISLGATTAPRRWRAKPRSSRRSASVGSWPCFRETNAFTTSIATGSGFPITPASATAGCSMSTLSTSKGPIRCPDDLMTSSIRPTNQ